MCVTGCLVAIGLIKLFRQSRFVILNIFTCIMRIAAISVGRKISVIGHPFRVCACVLIPKISAYKGLWAMTVGLFNLHHHHGARGRLELGEAGVSALGAAAREG